MPLHRNVHRAANCSGPCRWLRCSRLHPLFWPNLNGSDCRVRRRWVLPSSRLPANRLEDAHCRSQCRRRIWAWLRRSPTPPPLQTPAPPRAVNGRAPCRQHLRRPCPLPILLQKPSGPNDRARPRRTLPSSLLLADCPEPGIGAHGHSRCRCRVSTWPRPSPQPPPLQTPAPQDAVSGRAPCHHDLSRSCLLPLLWRKPSGPNDRARCRRTLPPSLLLGDCLEPGNGVHGRCRHLCRVWTWLR